MAATAEAPKQIRAKQRARRSHWARILRRRGLCADCSRKIAEAK